MSRHSNQSNWNQFQLRPPSGSRNFPSTPSGINLDMSVTPVPLAGDPMDERPPSRSSMKQNPIFDGSPGVASAGFVDQYRGKTWLCLYFD